MTPMASTKPAFAFASPDHALEALTNRIKPVGSERLPLARAAGRVLAEDILADRPSPACDVSAMDGYAIRAEHLTPGTRPIVGEIPIGQEPPIMPGTMPDSGPDSGVMHIVTGAPVPAGVHAVIRREDCTELDGAIEITQHTIDAAPPGANIRRKGENLAQGAPVANKGARITPATSGALATVGAAEPLVYQRVRVALLITGDEVLDPHESPAPWQLRDSNGLSLACLLAVHPWLELVTHARAPDDRAALRAAMASALDAADALLCTGGVSMGNRDFVPEVTSELGAETVFHKLPQRPGKPALAAVTSIGQPVLGLPGNPVSVLVTARRLALPALATRAGIARWPSAPALTLTNPDDRSIKLWWQRPVRLVAPGKAELIPTKGSGDIPSVAASDGFVEIPPGNASPGPFAFYPWDS